MSFRREHLRYFVAVAEEGQITRAAVRLHLAQPALTQAIHQLEADVGVPLFERRPRGVVLTAAGETLLPAARATVAAWADAEETARSVAADTPRRVEFGFVGGPPGPAARAGFRALAEGRPFLELRFRELSFPTSPLKDWLGDVDMAISHRPASEAGVWLQPISVQPRYLIVADDHPLAARESIHVEEVLDEPFVGLHPAVEPGWAAFFCLDDHRGGRGRRTDDETLNATEVMVALGVRRAVAVAPAMFARQPPHGIAGIPLEGATPGEFALSGREDRVSPLVALIRTLATGGAGGAGDGGAPAPAQAARAAGADVV